MHHSSSQALHFMYEYLVSVYGWAGSISDISTILHYQEHYYEQISHTHSNPLAIIRYVQAQAASEGLDFHEETIEEVLEAEYAYWQAHLA